MLTCVLEVLSSNYTRIIGATDRIMLQRATKVLPILHFENTRASPWRATQKTSMAKRMIGCSQQSEHKPSSRSFLAG